MGFGGIGEHYAMRVNSYEVAKQITKVGESGKIKVDGDYIYFEADGEMIAYHRGSNVFSAPCYIALDSRSKVLPMKGFRTGQTVTLKSGGPKMTTVDVPNRIAIDRAITCGWFDTENHYHVAVIDPDALDLTEQ